MTGASIDVGADKTALNMAAQTNTNVIGRYKEMHQVLRNMLSPNPGKIYTVWGLHGIGKTALVHAVMHYVNERKLIKGGFCYLNANRLTNCEVFLRNLNLELVKNNSRLFGPSKDFFENQTKDCMGMFMLVLKQIRQLEQTVVFIVDSCEGLIDKDKQMFRQVLKLILAEIP